MHVTDVSHACFMMNAYIRRMYNYSFCGAIRKDIALPPPFPHSPRPRCYSASFFADMTLKRAMGPWVCVRLNKMRISQQTNRVRDQPSRVKYLTLNTHVGEYKDRDRCIYRVYVFSVRRNGAVTSTDIDRGRFTFCLSPI